MALASLSELTTSIIAYSMRVGDAGFAAQVPTFIKLAESRINRVLRVAEMERVSTVSLSQNGGVLPCDYLEWRGVSGGFPTRDLSYITPGQSVEVSPNGGEPRSFSVAGNRLNVYPGNPPGGTVRMSYYAKVPDLTEDEPTNWLLEKAPELYLYGALIETAPFLMDDSRLQTWTTLFQKALADLQSADTGARYANAAARVSGPTP